MLKTCNKQQIKVTILETKIVSNLKSFYLKLKINEDCQSSDVFSAKLNDQHKSFIFELSSPESTVLKVTALSRIMVLLDSEIANISINLNSFSFKEDNIEWYSLKSSTDEEMIKIQMSIVSHISSSIKKPKSIDIDMKSNARVNYSIDESNFVHKNQPVVQKKLNNTVTFENNVLDKSQSSNLDETIVYDESSKSPDISNICGEFFSPKSKRKPMKVFLNQTSIKSEKTTEESPHNLTANNYVNLNIDKLIDMTNNSSTNNYVFDTNKIKEFLKKLKNKELEMKERENKLLKEQEALSNIKGKLRDRETTISKDNKKLEKDIQKLNYDKKFIETQKKSKNSRFQKLEIEKLSSTAQKELHTFDKEVFIMMNCIINSFNFVEINEISVSDNTFIINNSASSKKKSDTNDFTPPVIESKNKQLFKRYNTDHNISVYKSNTKLNNLNNITVIESSDFSLLNITPITTKECLNIIQVREFNHLDLSPDKNLCDIKEMDETESIHIDKKNLNKILYNFNKKNTNDNIDVNNSISGKKNNIETPKMNTKIQTKLCFKKETSCGKNKDLNQIESNYLTKSYNLNSPINSSNAQKNLEFLTVTEKNNFSKNDYVDKRRNTDDKKNKIDTEILRKKNMILAKISKDNMMNKKKSLDEKSDKKISTKNLSANSNHISTNNSSINSSNTNQKQIAKSMKKGK